MDETAAAQGTATTSGWINLALGLWMVISSWVLGFSHDTAARWNNIATGLAIVLLSSASLKGWAGGILPGVIVLIGVWLFASPFVLGFPTAAFLWNNVLMAFVVIGGAAVGEELRAIRSSETPPPP